MALPRIGYWRMHDGSWNINTTQTAAVAAFWLKLYTDIVAAVTAAGFIVTTGTTNGKPWCTFTTPWEPAIAADRPNYKVYISAGDVLYSDNGIGENNNSWGIPDITKVDEVTMLYTYVVADANLGVCWYSIHWQGIYKTTAIGSLFEEQMLVFFSCWTRSERLAVDKSLPATTYNRYGFFNIWDNKFRIRLYANFSDNPKLSSSLNFCNPSSYAKMKPKRELVGIADRLSAPISLFAYRPQTVMGDLVGVRHILADSNSGFYNTEEVDINGEHYVAQTSYSAMFHGVIDDMQARGNKGLAPNSAVLLICPTESFTLLSD